jgi:hypothetical protein
MTNEQIGGLMGMPPAEQVEGCSRFVRCGLNSRDLSVDISKHYLPNPPSSQTATEAMLESLEKTERTERKKLLCPFCGYHLYEDEFWHFYFCIKCNKRFKLEE